MTATKQTRFSVGLKVVLALIVVIGLWAAFRYLDFSAKLKEALTWIDHLGWWGVAAFIFLYVAACLFLIPGSLLTLGAGFVYGVVKGAIIVSAASTLGATLAFLAGRTLARHWVTRQIEGRPFFRAMDEAMAREGWKIVLLTRLSPVFPFNLLNYTLGLTQIQVKSFILTSWIGMLPGTVMYVYLGSLAGSLASLGSEGRTRTTGEWILYGVGLVATVVVTVYVTRMARQALSQKIASPKERDE